MAEIVIDGETYKLSCTMYACEKGMHSFKTNQTLQKKGIEKGCCRNCRSSLIDWNRLYRKDLDDFEYTKNAQKLEMIRNCFWSIKTPDQEMLNKINKNTPQQLREKVTQRLHTTLSKPHNENAFDGRQTKIDSNNLIYWAQHATGTCCRICLEQWYGIDANIPISDPEYEYLTQVVLNYLNEKTAQNDA